jgi:hypothetical protein
LALYFLDYDLRKKRDYKTLYDELSNFAATRVLESTWCFIRFNTTCADLRDHFTMFVDADDGLIVTEVSGWAGKKLNGNPPSNWQ